MSRPFFNKSIRELENVLSEDPSDRALLQMLCDELSHRSTDRAQKLKIRIEGMLTETINRPIKPKSPPSSSSQTAAQSASMKTFTLTDEEKIKIQTKIENEKRSILSNTPTDILRSWTALEVLAPQVYRSPEKQLIAALDTAKLPWEGAGEKSRPNYRLYYEIVLGTIDIEKAVSALMEIYTDNRLERPAFKGKAILATLLVDRTGRLVESPAVAISSFGWGVPKALRGNLSALSEWTNAEQGLIDGLEKIVRRIDNDGNEVPLDRNTINAAYFHILNELNLPDAWVNPPTFATRTYEFFKNQDPPEPSLLNSFFLNDLATAKGLFYENNATANLSAYLGLKKPTSRSNLLGDSNALEAVTAPAHIPPARWPGPGRHSLVLLQQAAVNMAISELKNTGILAVNGPPGTGKTTLLRDVIAAIVTQRAQAMCMFNNPTDAFETTGQKLRAGSAWLHFYKLSEKLKGHEILITSSNNKAVENVSAELPGLHTIADDIADLRYFSPLSTTLLGKDSWGLIAAVLGNAANRSKFRQTFWWDNDIGLSTYLAEAAGTPQLIEIKDPQTNKIIETRPPRIIAECDAPNNPAQAMKRWQQARASFQAALTESKTALEHLAMVRKTIIELQSLAEEEQRAFMALQDAYNQQKRTQMAFTEAEKLNDTAETALQAAQREQDAHYAQKPSFLARLLQRTAYLPWKEKWHHLSHNTKKCQTEYESHLTGFLAAKAAVEAAVSQIEALNALHTSAVTAHTNASLLINKMKSEIPQHLIDNAFFTQEHTQKHITIPWCDQATQHLRDNVFISAIKLHKAFIDAAARPLRHNLGLFMQVLSGRTLPDMEKQALLQDLWSSFFLVVPSVSTTFASVERMLKKLPPDSLGWLLVDEAGQALPQAAIGAIMRTKRAVVVGDPIQIEPVVPLPDTLTQNICRHFGVDPDHYNAPGASIQTIADEITPYYAEFDGKHGCRTVGVPLLVHRRCADPMFSISNAIAYERLMVQAKQHTPSAIKDCLGPSTWIDVQGQPQEKWCPQEGEVVLDLLRKLKQAKIHPDLYIVTPFVVVQDNLRQKLRESNILQGWVNDPYQWTIEHIGTVHTVQGREAEAVIFVLGAPSPAQNGARSWAGSRPNLLNVAITRAKEVIYVVGNRNLWQTAGLFKELSDRIS